jgi:hypothetical protein
MEKLPFEAVRIVRLLTNRFADPCIVVIAERGWRVTIAPDAGERPSDRNIFPVIAGR